MKEILGELEGHYAFKIEPFFDKGNGKTQTRDVVACPPTQLWVSFAKVSHLHISSKRFMQVQTLLRFIRDPQWGALAGVLSLIVGVHLLIERPFRSVPRKDTPFLNKLNRVTALAYSIFSAVCFVASINYFYVEFIQAPTSAGSGFLTLVYCGDMRVGHVRTMLVIYFWAKLWEGLLDLNLVTLRGIPIHIHFRLHHYTTPIFAWLGLATGSAHGFSFMLLNLWMHVCVYSWHGGVRMPGLHHFIRYFQYVQLFGGITVCGLAFAARLTGRYCTTDNALGWAADTIPAVLYFMYYQLFLIELRDFAEKRKGE